MATAGGKVSGKAGLASFGDSAPCNNSAQSSGLPAMDSGGHPAGHHPVAPAGLVRTPALPVVGVDGRPYLAEILHAPGPRECRRAPQSMLLLPAHDLALSVQFSGGCEITENGVLKLGIPDTKFDQVANADEP